MENLVRTVYGAAVQTSTLTGVPLVLKQYTTLDEKYGYPPATTPPTLALGEIPILNVLVIGDGGHHTKTAADGNIVPKILQHRATDAALFRHRPFIMQEKLPTENAPPIQGGYTLAGFLPDQPGSSTGHWAWWGKIITPDNLVVQTNVVTVVNGVTSTEPFIPQSTDLSPVPPVVPPAGANTTDGTYVTTTAKIHVKFTPDEVAEYLNVSKVLYGDDDFAIISEMGFCTSVNPVNNGGKAFQVAAHMGCFYAMKQLQNGLDIIVDVGVTEPMYNITPIVGP